MSYENPLNTDIENRSEIVLLYDAQDTNPNGDPLSANNKPRIDSVTNEAVVTDVRLKRYIRDQLDDDGHNVYIKNPSKKGGQTVSRDQAFEDVMGVDDEDDIWDMEGDEIIEKFMNKAIDSRIFGCTLTFNEQYSGGGDSSLSQSKGMPSQFIGPVQFRHGRTLNKVSLNTESKKGTTVIGSEEGKSTGTFVEDNRINYGLIAFNGVCNENAAASTGLSNEDIELLDKTIWKSITNQTLTRSKVGQYPRLYIRVEYSTDNYHIGDLTSYIEFNSDLNDKEIRNISDLDVDLTRLVDIMEDKDDHIEELHIKSSPVVSYNTPDKVVEGQELYEYLEQKFDTKVIEPY